MMNDQTLTAEPVATGPGLWSRADITDDAWMVPLGPEAQAEIAAFLRAYRSAPVPLFLLQPRDYDFAHCAAAVARARHILEQGVGFVLLDRIDLDSMTDDEGRAVYWMICNLLSRPVAQSQRGSILHEVRDHGMKAEPGSKVRPNETNQDIAFHNDNAFNPLMPDYVGLLCLQAAREGGLSRVMHLNQVHSLLQAHHPEVLPRLFEPFWLFRNGQHDPDEPPVIAEPIFNHVNGRLCARFGIHMILGGYRHRGEPLDTRGVAALAAIENVFAMPDYQFEFAMHRGQIQFVQNLQIGHSRSDFVDFDEPERKRCLVRSWLRARGRPSYTG